jgi:hypothetical protein
MTYQIKKTTGTYNARGTKFVKEVCEIVFESDDLFATMKFRYESGLKLHFTSKNTVVKYATINEDGREIFFDEMFLILEGQAAYNAVMDGSAPPQSEQQYVRAA